MARWRPEQTVFVLGVSLAFLTAYFAVDLVTVLLRPPGTPPPHLGPVTEINDSAVLSVVAWCLAGAFPVWGRLARGRFPTVWVKFGRLLYSWACALTLLHIAVAFHAAHGWSHARAYDHVERTSGFGPGLFVNYAFAAIWLADVVWSWIALDHYLDRPRWLGWGVLLFMAFIVFNAAVVFGSGHRRWVSAGLFLLPLYAIWATRPWIASRKTSEPGRRPGSGRFSESPAGHSPT
jgi:hypothetical protein